MSRIQERPPVPTSIVGEQGWDLGSCEPLLNHAPSLCLQLLLIGEFLSHGPISASRLHNLAVVLVCSLGNPTFADADHLPRLDAYAGDNIEGPWRVAGLLLLRSVQRHLPNPTSGFYSYQCANVRSSEMMPRRQC